MVNPTTHIDKEIIYTDRRELLRHGFEDGDYDWFELSRGGAWISLSPHFADREEVLYRSKAFTKGTNQDL